MKQHIKMNQLKELSPEQQEKLIEWWQPQKGDLCEYYEDEFIIDIVQNQSFWFSDDPGRMLTKKDCFPLLSIGQRLQLIEEKTSLFTIYVHLGALIKYRNKGNEMELIDALWNDVKALLQLKG